MSAHPITNTLGAAASMEATDSRRFSPARQGIRVGFGEAREIHLLKHAVGGPISLVLALPHRLGADGDFVTHEIGSELVFGLLEHHADTAQQFLAFPVNRAHARAWRGLEVVGDEHLAGDRLEQPRPRSRPRSICPAPFGPIRASYFAGIEIQIDTNAKSGPTAKA